MPPVKPLDRASNKWVNASAAATGEYEAGVRNPRKSWSQAAQNAAAAYKQGVTAAANEGRFEKGVQRAGDNKWQDAAIQKGVPRWSQGISVSEAAWRAGFAPFAQVIENTNLSPRGPKGSPQNYKRVQEMGDALHKAKIQRGT